jgi:hypothetical protein
VTIIGSKRFLVYEGKFEKRSITTYDYEIDTAMDGTNSLEELPSTIPARITDRHQLKGFQNQEPLAAAAKDFLDSIRERRPPLSNGDFPGRYLRCWRRERSPFAQTACKCASTFS